MIESAPKNLGRVPEDLESERILNRIAHALNSPEATHAFNLDSLGGNTGDGKIAVNAFVDRRTGEIVAFGNPQHAPEKIKRNPDRYGEVTFAYRAVPDPKNGQAEGFFDVSSDDPRISAQALHNLKLGITVYRIARSPDGLAA